MTVSQTADKLLSAESFLAWQARRPPGGRFELLDGIAIEMSAEQAIHARLKGAIYRQLDRLIAERSLPCEAFVDGMAVRVDDSNVFEPDVLVRCGPPLPNETLLIEDPLIVVEVASPSTQRIDALTKFARYFRNPTITHYLIAVPRDGIVIHHRRDGDGIGSASYDRGVVWLEPPGVGLSLDALFAKNDLAG